MTLENYTSNLLNENMLNCFESFFEFKLPKHYRDFILKFNGGKINKNKFYLKEDEIFVRYLFGFVPEYSFGILERIKMYNSRIPNNMIPIGSDDYSNLILLSVKGPDYGKVYYWDHEMETEPADYSNLTLVADSFQEFIDNLKSEDELES